MNKCYLNTYSPYINLLGIVFLIIILIFTIGYYIYISYIHKNYIINKDHNNKDDNKIKDIDIKNNIENFACRTVEQSQMDVSMRDCAIYFIQDKDYCDKYYNLYKLGKSQLEALQYLNHNYGTDKNKKELYDVATNIINQKFIDPNGLNNKPCKITIPNWKEINNIENPDASQNIYPNKNAGVNMDTTLGNLLLWGTCFKEIQNDSELSTGPASTDTIMRMCDPNLPITNIRDVNNTKLDQKYMAIDFKSLDGNALLTTFCSTFPTTGKININQGQRFIKIGSFFINNQMKTNSVSIVYYDSVQNKFFDIPDYDIYNEYIKLFRFTYTAHNIYFGPLKRNVTAKIMYTNECGNYESDTNISCFFSLKDFGINDKLLTSANEIDFTNSTPTSEYIDYKDYLETKIRDYITKLLSNNNALNIDLQNISNTKKNLENELNTLQTNYNNSPNTFTIPYTVENPVYNDLKSQILNLQRNLQDSPPTLSVNVPVTNPDIAINQSELDSVKKTLVNTDKFNYKFIPNLKMTNYYYNNIGRWGWSFQGLSDAKAQPYKVDNPIDKTDINIFDPDSQESIIHIFEGTINFEKEGYYIFNVDGDDDCELSIDTIIVAHYYGGHGRSHNGMTTRIPIFIEKGIHNINARMLEWWGASSITATFIMYDENDLQKIYGNEYFILKDSNLYYSRFQERIPLQNNKALMERAYININDFINSGISLNKIFTTLLYINGDNRTNYVFVDKIAEPNPVWNKIQIDIDNKRKELSNTPATVDNYEIVTNSIYTGLQNQINNLQKQIKNVQPLIGKTRIETNQQKISLALIIQGKEAVIAVVNSTVELIRSKIQANLELNARLSSLKTYLINGPNIKEVNDIIKAGVILGNLNNYQKCISTDNNIYILIDY